MNRFFYGLSAALLLSAPATASTHAAHFEGALLKSETPLRLQRAAVYFQEGGPGAFGVPVEQMTREQLQIEYQRLDVEKPGLGGPIALLAVGGGLLFVCLPFLYLAVVAFAEGGATSVILLGYIFLVFGAALAITGGVLLTVGLVKLFQRIGERRAYAQRMEDINARLESLDRTGAPPPPPPPSSMPPPPPPGAELFHDVEPGLVLATF